MLTEPKLTWLLEAADLCTRHPPETRPRAVDLRGRVSPDWNIQKQLLTDAGWNPGRHKNVIGRKFVRDAFERYAASCTRHGGVFIVEGPPGVGKSALLTDWQDRLGSPAGFYFRYLENRTAPETMAEQIEDQLLQLSPLPPARRGEGRDHTGADSDRDGLEKLGERGRRLPRVLDHVSKHLAEGARLVLFVDALDEASNPVKAAELIPLRPPRGVFFVVSTRPPVTEGNFRTAVQNAGGVYFPIDPTGPDNTRDLVEFFKDRLGTPPLAPGQAEELTRITGGSFLLATLFVEGLQW